MTIAKLRRCKRIIASPNYYRDRAIQMGETYGALKAEYFLLRFSSPTEYLEIDRIGTKLNRYKQKCVWYARRVAVWSENLDYNT